MNLCNENNALGYRVKNITQSQQIKGKTLLHTNYAILITWNY